MAELAPWVPQHDGGGVPVKTGATVAALGAGDVDGARALLRVGAYPDVHEEPLSWDQATGKWIGEPKTLITQGDSWAMDLGNRSGAQLLDWSAVDNAVPYGKSHALIKGGALDLSAAAFNPGTGTGVITVDDTSSPHSFPFQATSQPYLQIRDNYITYTGKTATTFTGCTVVQGSRGSIPQDEWVLQGYPGGWGFEADSLPFAAQLFAAGLSLQERLTAMMNRGPGDHLFTIAPYWRQYDPGDGAIALPIPPAGGLGVSAALAAAAGTGGLVGNADERSFYLHKNDWSAWPLAAPIKKFLLPKIVGKMAAAAVTTGTVLDVNLTVRWAS